MQDLHFPINFFNGTVKKEAWRHNFLVKNGGLVPARNISLFCHRIWGSEVLSYEGVSLSFQTSRLERELQMVQLSITGCSCITILWVSLVNFASIALCVPSTSVYCCYFLIDLARKPLDTTSYSEFWVIFRRVTRVKHETGHWPVYCHLQPRLRMSGASPLLPLHAFIRRFVGTGTMTPSVLITVNWIENKMFSYSKSGSIKERW
jgi:hypothetical protein